LLDHLVGGDKQRVWRGQAERLCGLEVDHQLKLGRELHWQIAGPRTVENLIGEGGEASRACGEADAIADEATVNDMVAPA
jgi:hypothetical protein